MVLARPGQGLSPVPAPPRLVHRWWLVAIGTAVALGYASLASSTRPFTGGAGVVTAVPLAVAVAVMALRMRSARSSVPPVPPAEEHGDRRVGWTMAWAAMAAVILGWELACYAAAPRWDHPTLSSLLDTLDSHRAGKTVAFVLWLAVGAYLVLQ
jgi:hypothetical protein